MWSNPDVPRALLLALGAATVLVGAGLLLRDHGPRDVVFVVLDNVRADHLSLCGYERPTSPNLEAFAATAWSSCEAVVPGSWTVPSHASFLTGLEVAHHGAHYARGAVVGVSGDKPWQRAFVFFKHEDGRPLGWETIRRFTDGLV